MEIWRDVTIDDWGELYQVSNKNHYKVKAHTLRNGAHWKEKVMNPMTRKNHYQVVQLSKDGVKKTYNFHKLVALAFPEICGEWFPGAEINHLDENPSNNRPENLRWVTHTENINWGNRTKKAADKISKPVIQYTVSGEFVRRWVSISQAEDEKGWSTSSIAKCCLGRPTHKTAYGYIWKYETEAIN